MAEGLPHRRSNRLLVVFFALIGAVLGLYWLFVFSDPVTPLMIVGPAEYNLPGPQPAPTLTVVFFGRFSYSRTAADPAAFNAEIMIWQFAPLVLAVLIGALGGGLAGHLAGRWIQRRRRFRFWATCYESEHFCTAWDEKPTRGNR